MLHISHIKTSSLADYVEPRAHDTIIVMPTTDMKLPGGPPRS